MFNFHVFAALDPLRSTVWQYHDWGRDDTTMGASTVWVKHGEPPWSLARSSTESLGSWNSVVSQGVPWRHEMQRLRGTARILSWSMDGRMVRKQRWKQQMLACCGRYVGPNLAISKIFNVNKSECFALVCFQESPCRNSRERNFGALRFHQRRLEKNHAREGASEGLFFYHTDLRLIIVDCS